MLWANTNWRNSNGACWATLDILRRNRAGGNFACPEAVSDYRSRRRPGLGRTSPAIRPERAFGTGTLHASIDSDTWHDWGTDRNGDLTIPATIFIFLVGLWYFDTLEDWRPVGGRCAWSSVMKLLDYLQVVEIKHHNEKMSFSWFTQAYEITSPLFHKMKK